MNANWVKRIAATATVIALASVTSSVKAEDEFEVNVSKGQVVVHAKGDWHINLEFPWKLVVGDTKLDKSKFSLTEKNATVAQVPPGVGKLRGAVCSHESCHTLEREVTIP